MSNKDCYKATLMKFNFAIIISRANKREDFNPFVNSLTDISNLFECGGVYFVLDSISKDNALELCSNLSATDDRFVTILASEKKNVVGTYLRGHKEVLKNKHEFII